METGRYWFTSKDHPSPEVLWYDRDTDLVQVCGRTECQLKTPDIRIIGRCEHAVSVEIEELQESRPDLFSDRFSPPVVLMKEPFPVHRIAITHGDHVIEFLASAKTYEETATKIDRIDFEVMRNATGAVTFIPRFDTRYTGEKRSENGVLKTQPED